VDYYEDHLLALVTPGQKERRIMRSYLLESVVAAYVSTLLAYIAQSGLGILLGTRHWIKALMAPTFLLPVAGGALAAYVMGKRLSKGSYFVWCIPLALLCWAFLGVIKAPYATRSEVWDTMIGTDCSSSECLYEAFFSVPFVCSFSYSVSAAAVQAIRRAHAMSAQEEPDSPRGGRVDSLMVRVSDALMLLKELDPRGLAHPLSSCARPRQRMPHPWLFHGWDTTPPPSCSFITT